MRNIDQHAWWRQLFTSLAPVLIAVMSTSCSGDKRVPVYPVEGQVLFAGKPLPRAFLVFHPLTGDALRPLGTVDDEGYFTLTTYDQADGAPAGEYAVTVEWRRLATVDDEKRPPNQLPRKYANPRTSGLSARITAGTNVLPPFQLSR